MRHAAILDVLRAIKDVSGIHPEIGTWWYAPARRLRLSGERGRGRGEVLEIEIVIEPPLDGTVDCDHVAAELGSRLPGDSVIVRLHRGSAEQQRLFRLKSGELTSAANSLRASS
jgi:hypothetical protein